MSELRRQKVSLPDFHLFRYIVFRPAGYAIDEEWSGNKNENQNETETFETCKIISQMKRNKNYESN